MRQQIVIATFAALVSASVSSILPAQAPADTRGFDDTDRAKKGGHGVQLGPRPFFLVNDMSDGPAGGC
jgi:hypothetical protein